MPDDIELDRPVEPTDLGSLSDSLGLLFRLAQLTAFRDFFSTLGPLDISPGELSVLTLIRDYPGVRQGLLAKRLMIKRAHMTKLIHAMEADGLVVRSIPDDDRRSVELRLTAAGEELVARLQAPFARLEARAARKLTVREAATLKRLLRKYLDMPEASGDARS